MSISFERPGGFVAWETRLSAKEPQGIKGQWPMQRKYEPLTLIEIIQIFCKALIDTVVVIYDRADFFDFESVFLLFLVSLSFSILVRSSVPGLRAGCLSHVESGLGGKTLSSQ